MNGALPSSFPSQRLENDNFSPRTGIQAIQTRIELLIGATGGSRLTPPISGGASFGNRIANIERFYFQLELLLSEHAFDRYTATKRRGVNDAGIVQRTCINMQSKGPNGSV